MQQITGRLEKKGLGPEMPPPSLLKLYSVEASSAPTSSDESFSYANHTQSVRRRSILQDELIANSILQQHIHI